MRVSRTRPINGFLLGVLFIAALLLSAPSSTMACAPKVKTMTRNLYLGADIFKVVEAAMTPDPADPLKVPRAVAEVFQTMQYTNFPERAEAIADEIALFEPDVIGLQEVSTYYIQTPADSVTPNPTPADTLVIDFYTVLNNALLARGMEYTAYTVTNADIEMPMLDPASPIGLSDVRLVDHDVILVRDDHSAANEYKGNYQWQLQMDLGSATVAFTRGYIALDVDVKGTEYRFVNTHLEVRSAPGSVYRVFQAAQMQELMAILSYENKPVILIGDFNSSPEDEPGVSDVPGMGEVPYVPPYLQAVYAGYVDTWLEQRKIRNGFTSGFDEYVSDPTAKLTSRIDLVFAAPKDLEIDKVKARVVGYRVSDMTPSGLWPSDHAGVVTKIKFER